MEIIWNSNSTFTISSTNGTLLINPTSEDHVKKASVLVYSGSSNNVEDTRDTFEHAYDVSWPGEYETQNTLIVGVEGATSKKNSLEVMYAITVPENITIGYIGEISERPASKSIEKLGNIDILLLAIDERNELKSKDFVGIIEEVEAKIVIPFYTNEGSLELFSKALAEALPEAQKSLKIQKSQLSDASTAYITLQAL